MKHCWPLAVHIVTCPQTPLLHACEQHSALDAHGLLSAVHIDAGWQEKLTQLPEQQLKSAPQPAPLPWQPRGPQTPLLHCCWQHSAAEAHLSPFALHVGAPQTPLLHCCEQQSARLVHGEPSGEHVGIELQTPLEHC
jgi:hypothetical protein